MNRAVDPGWVYRIYDETGTLLYVGCTHDVHTRLLAHARRDWWPATPRVETTRYDPYYLAYAAEQDEIRRTGGGLHNVTQAETARRGLATGRRRIPGRATSPMPLDAVEGLIGESAEAFAWRHRSEGMAWERIAARLHDATDGQVSVTGQALRLRYAEAFLLEHQAVAS